MECFLKRAFAKTERGARRVGARRVGARCGARRAGRVVRGVSRAIRCVARDFDLCLWARGDRGRFHEIQLEKRLQNDPRTISEQTQSSPTMTPQHSTEQPQNNYRMLPERLQHDPRTTPERAQHDPTQARAQKRTRSIRGDFRAAPSKRDILSTDQHPRQDNEAGTATKIFNSWGPEVGTKINGQNRPPSRYLNSPATRLDDVATQHNGNVSFQLNSNH